MKIYVIKHKGKNTWGNLISNPDQIIVGDEKLWQGKFYFRLKDAKKIMSTFSYPEFFEIESVELK
jgi:hypothetical protein